MLDQTDEVKQIIEDFKSMLKRSRRSPWTTNITFINAKQLKKPELSYSHAILVNYKIENIGYTS